MNVAYANHVWSYETIADFVRRRGGTIPPPDNNNGEFALQLNGNVTVYYAQGYAPIINSSTGNLDIDRTLHGIARSATVKYLYGNECIERIRHEYRDGTYINIYEAIYQAIALQNYEPAPPPPPDDCECMCRCNNDSNNDQLLRLILKRIGPLPAAVPNSLVKKNSGT
ncbi:hypothetical protein LC593_36785, partial [Nostoc sp. CHAB 5844]|nr:hypothetical protein [Nostoc sp. CHAB 5844]